MNCRDPDVFRREANISVNIIQEFESLVCTHANFLFRIRIFARFPSEHVADVIDASVSGIVVTDCDWLCM